MVLLKPDRNWLHEVLHKPFTPCICPAPSPPPLPSHQLRPFFPKLGRLSPPCAHSYTWYTGVSQNNFLWQKYLASIFWKFSPIFFFFAAWHPCFFRNTLCRKMLSLLRFPLTRKSFSRSFFCCSFSPFLNKCQLLMPKDFWNLPVLPCLACPWFMEGGEGKQITWVVTQFYCPLSPNSQTSEFLIYSFCTFKIFC